jgi:RimJ/RimL family protein N-acetyltransferase
VADRPRCCRARLLDSCRFHRRGYATACARAQAGLALSGVVRVEVHTDEPNAISAAIPRRLGYRLDRVDEAGLPEAPAHSGRQQIWVMERPGPDGQDEPPLHRDAG